MSLHRNGNAAAYALPTAAAADPLTVEEMALLTLGIQSAENVIGRTTKGGRIYSRHPQLVADVNRSGKRFLSALAAVIQAATRQSNGLSR